MNKNYSIVIALLMFFNLSLFSQDGPPWDFNGTDHGFVAQNYTSITIGDTYLTYTINSPNDDGNGGSANPNFKNTAANIDTSAGGYIAITMQNLTGNARVQVITNAGSNVFTNFDALSTNDTDFVTHYINMSNASNWTGTMDNINFRFKQGNGVNDNVYSGDILIDNIEIVASIPATPRVDYTFDDTSDSEGFTSANGVTMSQPVAGELHLDIANQSPYPKLEQTGLYSVDADTYKYVQVTLVNNSPKNKLTFVSPSGGNEYATGDMTANSSDTQTVEADLSALTNWTGTQGNWWFQLVENPGDGAVASAGEMDIQQILFATESINPSTGESIPWTDSFETEDVWTNDASYPWKYGLAQSYEAPPSAAQDGTGVVFFDDYSYSTGNTGTILSPEIDLSSATDPIVSFYHYDGTANGNGDTVEVVDGTGAVIFETPAVADEWTKHTVSLSAYVGGTVQVGFKGTSVYGYSNPHIDNVFVGEAPTEPTMSVSSSTGIGSATFSFTLENFTVGASGDTGVDGHIHYSLNGGAEVMVYSSDDLTLTDLPNGDHTIVFSLVDENHTALDPAVEATVQFTTFNACGETVTYTQVANGDYTVGATAAAGEVASVTVSATMENNYDYLYVTDGAGNLLNTGETTGTIDATYESTDGTISVNVTNDGSVQNGDVTLAFTCAAAQSNVTFNVDMSNYTGGLGADDTVYLNGSFNGWCGDCNPMSDDDGDGIWTITMPLDDGAYEYKFTVNGWNNQEQWTADGTPDCAENADDGTYENRALTVAGDDLTMPTVYWNLCVGEEPGNTYTVTFSVNTSAIVGGVGANGIYAGGGVLGNAQALQLTDDDGDGVWVGSIDLPEGTTGNYIFLNSPGDGGDWGAKENLEGQDCADPNNYNDRILPEVTADVTYLACFGECSGDGTGECPSDTVTYNLTMTVNTANITVGENGMYLGGGVFGGANAHAMSDDDGDGTWEVTVEVAEGTSGNYTFLNSPTSSSDWDAKENLEGQSCADPANYNDRILEAVNADTTLMHCFASCETDGSCPDGDPAMMLQGIIDFTVPEGGSDGKAIHLYVNEDISDLAQYGIGVANNGGGTDGQEYTFPTAAPTAGQHILVVRSVAAMDAYMNASSIFDHVFVDEGGSISQNGDDAIELYFLGGVVELFGDVDVDGTGEDWEYLDSWAYKVNGEWTYGGVNCTDGSTTTCDSGCPYPFADCTGDDLGAYLSAEGGWRYQYEVAGYRGVGPGDAMGADWWNAGAYEDFNNATFPNESGINNGLVDDIMFFTTDGGFTFDTGDDMTIMGKKPEVDAAFDPDGTIAYDADNDYNEYWNYPLDDFTDTYTLSNDGTHDVITFATVGALGFYTSIGAQDYQILQQNNTTMYVRNVGSEGNSWYSMLTTDAHALSTSNNEILEMMIYPNPVDGNYVTILSPVEGLKEIQVFTVTGRRVMDTTINGNTLDVSSFNSGFYMLKVTINGQTKVSKLVVR